MRYLIVLGCICVSSFGGLTAAVGPEQMLHIVLIMSTPVVLICIAWVIRDRKRLNIDYPRYAELKAAGLVKR